MEKRNEVYRCEACGNIVEILHPAGSLVCCNRPMILLDPQTKDSSTEKHVPYIIKENEKITVKVGENAAHPMEEKHYIQWIEILADDKIYRQYLNPGDKPEAVFYIKANNITAREYCNIHGHWKS